MPNPLNNLPAQPQSLYLKVLAIPKHAPPGEGVEQWDIKMKLHHLSRPTDIKRDIMQGLDRNLGNRNPNDYELVIKRD